MEKSLETLIVDSILDAIADQRLQAGTKLNELALSDLFKCNRVHVRRAFAILTGWQVVDHLPNRGAFVATPSPGDARDVLHARRAIEATICRNAVRLADGDDIADLRAHLAAEEEVRLGQNRAAAIRLSREFHMLLARIGRNPVLARFLAQLTMRSSLILGLYARGHATLCARHDHAGIVAAIEMGNEARALSLLDSHLRHLEASISLDIEPCAEGSLSAALLRQDQAS